MTALLIQSVIISIVGGILFTGLYATEVKQDGDTLSPLCLFTYWYVYFFYIPYLAVILFDINVWNIARIAYYANLAMVHVLVSYVVLALVYLRTNRTIQIKQFDSNGRTTTITPNQAKLVGLGLYGIGVVSWFFFVELNGGFQMLILAPDIWQFRTGADTLRYWILLQVGLLSGLGLYIGGSWDEPARWGSPTVFALAGLTAVIFLISHTRTRAMAPFLFATLYFHYNVRRLRVNHLAALGVAGALIVGLFRPFELLLQGAPVKFDSQFFEKFLYNYFFHNYAGLLATVPENIGYAYGRAFNVVPWLQFWPFTELRAHTVDYATIVELSVKGRDIEHIGESAGGIGKWYLNFGLLGVIFISALLGLVSKVIYLHWQLRQNAFTIGMYLIFVHYFFFVFGGDLFSYIHYVILVPIIILSILFR